MLPALTVTGNHESIAVRKWDFKETIIAIRNVTPESAFSDTVFFWYVHHPIFSVEAVNVHQ